MKAQCLPNGITFLNQESIDNFSTNYPGCTVIEGNVSISDAYQNITNLNGLSQIEEIQGSFGIGNSHLLVDLSGLESLHLIGGRFGLVQNNNLTSLQGLENVTSVETLSINNNDNLENISALNIMEIENSISISYNDKLNSLDGLENITSLDYLLIDGNNALLNLSGLEGIVTINNGFDILRNDSLLNLNGLNSLTTTTYILISENGSLQTLSGLDALTTTSEFYIQINNQLVDISNLSSLNMIDGSFVIIDNNMLTSLNGLEGLTAINGNLGIGRNHQLSSIEGIRNIDAETIINLNITDNTNLSECAVSSVCDHLDIDPENSYIIDNGIGCQNLQEVEDACALINVQENELSELKIYPNPTNGTFKVSNSKEGKIDIIDSQGRIIKEMDLGKNIYSISELSSGIYFIKITSNLTSVIKQIIKI